MPAHVPAPAPRKVRTLPWVLLAAGSAVGLVVFVLLWQVAVELQAKELPPPRGGAWQDSAPPQQ